MAQRRSLAWTELRVGLLVIVSFLLLTAAIIFVGGQTSPFTQKMTITAYFPDANGLRPGNDVSLDGVLIGSVSKVSIAKDPGPGHGVDVEMKLDKKYDSIIRSDSTMGIGTVGLLGDKTIEITRGTEAGKPVGDNGVIQGKEAGDIRRIIQGTDDLVANLNVLSDTIVEISGSIKQGKGTLGKLLTDTDIHDNLNKTVVEAQQLVTDIRTGQGTAGKLISDDELYRRINLLTGNVDNIVAKIDHGDGTIGKFMNDPALYDKMDQLIARIDGITDRVDRGEGTLGKLMKDDALYTDMRSAVTQVNNLVSSVQNGNGTAGKLINDPTLYNSLNQMTSELQKLLYDIKIDPKKYLTVNLRLF